MRLKRYVVALLAMLLPVAAHAGDTALLAINYDLDSADAVCVMFTGTGNSPFGDPISGPGRIVTSGASTTVTSSGGGDIFPADISAGDAIFSPTGTLLGLVASRTSASSIEMQAAVTIATSQNWQYLNFTESTTLTDCAISVEGYERVSVSFHLDQYTGDGNGLDWQVRCDEPKGHGSGWTNVDPGTEGGYTNQTAAAHPTVVINADFGACQVVLLHNTADDGTDTGTDAEIINITLTRTGGRSDQ